ncbi:MAG: hypothetical protein K0A90_09645 [Methanosarcinaceae archaeon]|nr:hypothetical protein [Methanosarcinaceae archaeon]
MRLVCDTDFLSALHKIERIGLNDIEHIIELLKKRAYMEFNGNQKNLLLCE